jgi:hypothetical protein
MASIKRIREKLARLRHLDRDCRAFGAEAHRYRLNAPLPETAIGAFEARHAVALPDGYRQFLLEVADGLAGPDYGVLPLEETVCGESLGLLREPFPLTEATQIPRDYPEIPLEDRDPEAYSQAMRPFWSGHLVLGASGCGGLNLLIVTGPERGRVWRYERVGDEFWPSGKDFLAWYECWLDGWLSPGG